MRPCVGPWAGAAFALAAAAPFGAWADDVQQRGRVPTITVQGEAHRDVVPDMAIIVVGVTADRSSAAEAANETGRIAQSLVAEIKASGVADRDVATEQMTLSPVYDTGRVPKVTGFRGTNSVEIKVHKLEQVGSLTGRLLDRGANDLQGITFVVADPEPVLDELRAAATGDARRRASIYARAAGVKLGRILDIQPETPAAIPLGARRLKFDAAMAPAPASAPVEAGSQTLDARVTITWELDQAAP